MAGLARVEDFAAAGNLRMYDWPSPLAVLAVSIQFGGPRNKD
jgi:hypothetical protein